MFVLFLNLITLYPKFIENRITALIELFEYFRAFLVCAMCAILNIISV